MAIAVMLAGGRDCVSSEIAVQVANTAGVVTSGTIRVAPGPIRIGVPPHSRELPLRNFRQIHISSANRASSPGLYQIQIVGGESIPCQLKSIDAHSARVTIWNGLEMRLPRAIVESVTLLPGNQLAFQNTFETPEERKAIPEFFRPWIALDAQQNHSLSLLANFEPWRVSLSDCGSDVCVQFRLFRNGRLASRQRGIRLGFGTEEPGRVIRWVDLNLDAPHGVEVRSDVESLHTISTVPLRTGENQITVRFLNQRMTVRQNDQLLAHGDALRGELRTMEVRAALEPDPPLPDRPEQKNELRIDDLKIVRRSTAELSAPLPEGQTGLNLGDGDRWFGECQDADATAIRFEVGGALQRVPWTLASGIHFQPTQAAPTVVSGDIARIVLAEPSEWLPRSRGVKEPGLIAAITGTESGMFRLQHPLFGSFDVPIDAVHGIEPLWNGRYLLIEPGRRHLGTQHRADFQRPAPQGTEFTGSFSIEKSDLLRKAYIRTTVFDLDAAHREAPVGTPHLSDLRSGGRLAELFLNGTRIGDLNAHLVWSRGVAGDQNIRISIPGGVLREGKNQLTIRLRPSRQLPSQYDDCEIGPVAVEIHDPPLP